MSKRTYYRIERFAIGDTNGGTWADPEIVSGKTPQEAFDKAVSCVQNKGFSYETTITLCDRHGEDFE